jgi:hypothetical protein
MALQSSGSISLGQVNTELNKSATASISLNDADVRNLAAIVSGQISMSNFYGKSSNPKPQQKAIFGFGVTQNTGKENNITNIITNTGVVGTDTPNTGIALPNQPLIGKEMAYRAAAGYGGDKAIFGFGFDRFYGSVSYVNRVSNTGVLASTSDLAVGRTGRQNLAAAGYGGDKAIFAYGNDGTNYNSGVSMKNLVSNAGVVAADVAGVGTRRKGLAAVGYGLDKALFAYGAQSQNYVAMQLSNLVTNTGVVGTDNSIAGRGREYLAGTGYGGDKGIFGYGNEFAFATVTNLVSNTGVVASELIAPGVGRYGTSGACFG